MQVIELAKNMVGRRKNYQGEILHIMQEFKLFNDFAAKECERVRPVLARLVATMPPPESESQR